MKWKRLQYALPLLLEAHWCLSKCFLPPDAVLSPQACAVIIILPLNLSALCRLSKTTGSNNDSNYKYVWCSELKKNTLKMKNAITREFFGNNTGRNGKFACL